jgi:competence protein ComEA
MPANVAWKKYKVRLYFSYMMTRLKRLIQSVVGLSAGEARAFLVLFPLVFIVIFSEPLFRWFNSDSQPLQLEEVIYLDSLVNDIAKADSTVPETLPTLFPFDPNVTSVDDFQKLGIPKHTASQIIRYRDKGGKFKVKSDLARIYGMDSLVYSRLLPFIKLPDKIEKEVFPKTERPALVIEYDLNLTDTTSLKSARGIGSTLAKRIIKQRESLGGFVRFSQLYEVYGLDSAVIDGLVKFYVSSEYKPRKININTATQEELNNHPYISPREAKAIITYRLQHNKFSNSSDLAKVKLLREPTIAKLDPYLSFE